MTRGDRVRVTIESSAFFGKAGTIVQVRTPPLPLGVKLDNRSRGSEPIWFCEAELELLP